MDGPNLFWTIFAAVLGANILTVVFSWCCININRRERALEGPGTYLMGFLLVLGFLGGSFYIAMGGT